ncbi:MAG: type II CAAX endopeptidase family protein [Eubacteriales bacterium]|nr:type II CAAX endopeptidase family protein [Eubacteriales bacterium]
MKKQSVFIIITVAVACVFMGLVDAVIQPGYVIKSLIKIVLFAGMSATYALLFRDNIFRRVFVPDKRGILIAAATGIAVYAVVLTAYFVFKDVFDFSALTKSLTSTTGVNRQNFLYVALYISFVNSLLEEYFFRGFAFLTLKKHAGRTIAYLFSAAMFALYHIAMMIGWFGWPVVLLSLVGLFAGGVIFNWLDEKFNNIYLSWLAHMFANFATNTIGFILFNS